jgi:formylglycine-generating enzyme required for sulfatase activity
VMDRRHVLPRPPAPPTQAVVATAEPEPTATWTMPDDGTPPGTLPRTDVVLVAAGEFAMGCNAEADKRCQKDELPARKVSLAVFQIDRLEVTVAKYAACVKAGRCSTDGLTDSELCNWGKADRTDHPVNCVDWNEASSYCQWAGMRLPTEAEWEKAARGDQAPVYPWGNTEPSCRVAIMDDGGDGCARDSTWPVGSRPGGASPYGALDMAGNVWEWVADRFEESYYAHAPSQNPPGPEGGMERSVRGGSWLSNDTADLRASERHASPMGYRNYNLGFRCAGAPTPEAVAAATAASGSAASSASSAPPKKKTKKTP